MTELGSYRSPIIEIGIQSKVILTPLESQNIFRSLNVEERARGAFNGSLTVFDKDGDYVEKLIIAAGAQKDIVLRWGWDTLKESPKIVGRIMNTMPSFSPAGTELTMDFVARDALISVLDLTVRSFSAGQRISDIVTKIASIRGWRTVDHLGHNTIEQTRTAINEPYHSKDESDMKFIQDKLLVNAENKDGEGAYRFFVSTDNVVHFHTPHFLTPKLFKYQFALTNFGRVFSFAPTDASVFAALMGAGESLVRGSDSKTGGAVEVRPNEALVTTRSGSPSSTVISDGITSIMHITGRDTEEIQRKAKIRSDLFKDFVYPATMQVIGTHDLHIFDEIDVSFTKVDGTLHYLSGIFTIFGLKHTLDSTGWKTDIDMSRSGIPSLPGTVPIKSRGTRGGK